eukprot:c5574_g1_i1.p1 GENE.c5574_g1_i1~~c5574_g1_i1.p1  ORF type:complete len:531 (+),score=115.51 c5574_g1_i1:56-1648(+)
MAHIDRAERENKIIEEIKVLVGAKEKYKLRKFNDPERDRKKHPRQFLRGADSDPESEGEDEDWTPERDAASILRAISDLKKNQEHIPAIVSGTGPSADAFGALKTWLGDAFAANWESVDIVAGMAEGSGLVARKALAAGEPFLFVSRAHMMAYEDALKAPLLGPLARSDRLLQQMPELVLSLLLLQEAADPVSKWRPYIESLPHSFTTPLYFTRRDFAELSGSPALADCLSFLKQSLRIYTYLKPIASQFGIAANRFSWANWAWASSAVVSRQNSIPLVLPGATETSTQLALIPVWDMCNHEPSGEITSFYDVSREGVAAQAVRAFGAGDAIYMNYGPRSNAKLLCFAGFAVDPNPYDTYPITLAVPEEGDELAPARGGMLAKAGIASECTFFLNHEALDPNLMLFARVLTLARSELGLYKGVMEGKRVSLENDLAALALLKATVEELAATAAAAAGDAGTADAAESTGLKRSMALLRSGERALLARSLVLIEDARATLVANADAKRAKKKAKQARKAAGAAAEGEAADE